jgi:type I restriction enzyme R subunit
MTPVLSWKKSDRQNARVENDRAPARVMAAVLKGATEPFKHSRDDESFKRRMAGTVFGLTCDQPRAVRPSL